MKEVNNIKLYHLTDNLLDDEFIIDDKYDSLINYDLNEREKVLENIRKKEHNNLISRLHCLYLCDINSVRYWERELERKYIYLLELNGVCFSSYDRFIPKHYQDLKTMENNAHKYWDNDIVDDYDKEYLFQGNVKVLKKLI